MKKWYQSKTLWANAVSILAVLVQLKYGYVVPVELQGIALGVVNIGLRAITKEEIIW
jgi:hypothetical protein